MRGVVKELKNISSKFGLSMNLTKTEYMSNRKGVNEPWIDDTKISKVEKYKYLGQLTKFNSNMETVITKRISNAWKTFWAHKTILKSKMKLGLKIKILESCVIPVLTYGAQSWSLTQRQVKRLQQTQNSMLRSILGIRLKDKVKNEIIRKQTGAKNIGYIIKKLKLKYAGHMIRNNSEKWNLKCTLWEPLDRKRKRGRPVTRWIDEFLNFLVPCWSQTARDRKRWKRVKETYALRWAE